MADVLQCRNDLEPFLSQSLKDFIKDIFQLALKLGGDILYRILSTKKQKQVKIQSYYLDFSPDGITLPHIFHLKYLDKQNIMVTAMHDIFIFFFN